MREETRLARAVFEALCRGALSRHDPDSIEPFDPEGVDEFVDIGWFDPETRSFRAARLTIELE
jgi:hypothetical protein